MTPAALTPFLALLLLSAPMAHSATPTERKPAMTQVQSKLPLFYRDLIAFDKDVHGSLTPPEQAHDFQYAKSTSVIPLLITEVSLALKSYPLVFIPAQDQQPPTLAAMVGIGDNINRFVDEARKWRPDTYIPAWVRRYPFLAVKQDGRDETVLALDPNASWLKQTGGEGLMKDGQPSERLKRIMAFNQEFQQVAERTNAMVQALYAAGVLEEGSLKFQPSGGSPEQAQEIKGFLLVSEKKLRELSEEDVLTLHKADAFGLAYAQLLSMGNLTNLFASPAIPIAPTSPKKSNASKPRTR